MENIAYFSMVPFLMFSLLFHKFFPYFLLKEETKVCASKP